MNLSQDIAALAERVALARRVSVVDAIREALEDAARAVGVEPQPPRRRDTSAEAVAARIARFEAMAQQLASAPVNDPRPVGELIEDINAL